MLIVVAKFSSLLHELENLDNNGKVRTGYRFSPEKICPRQINGVLDFPSKKASLTLAFVGKIGKIHILCAITKQL